MSSRRPPKPPARREFRERAADYLAALILLAWLALLFIDAAYEAWEFPSEAHAVALLAAGYMFGIKIMRGENG